MTKPDDVDFHRRREREEREIAARCADPAIAALHIEMAERHATLVHGHRPIAQPPVLRPA